MYSIGARGREKPNVNDDVSRGGGKPLRVN